jgi:prepilin-type N-terminal cleavage/methylation domain-containing protein
MATEKNIVRRHQALANLDSRLRGNDEGRGLDSRRRGNDAGSRFEAGFSLIELLITMFMLGVVTLLLLFGTDYMAEVQINGVTSSLADDLRRARSLSIKYGHDVEVTFNASTQTLTFYNDVNNTGVTAANVYMTRTLNNYGGSAKFYAVVSTGIDGLPITAPIVMGATSNPITATFHCNGAVSNAGVIYLASSSDGQLAFGRAVAIVATGMVQTWKYNAGATPGPWLRWI